MLALHISVVFGPPGALGPTPCWPSKFAWVFGSSGALASGASVAPVSDLPGPYTMLTLHVSAVFWASRGPYTMLTFHVRAVFGPSGALHKASPPR